MWSGRSLPAARTDKSWSMVLTTRFYSTRFYSPGVGSENVLVTSVLSVSSWCVFRVMQWEFQAGSISGRMRALGKGRGQPLNFRGNLVQAFLLGDNFEVFINMLRYVTLNMLTYLSMLNRFFASQYYPEKPFSHLCSRINSRCNRSLGAPPIHFPGRPFCQLSVFMYLSDSVFQDFYSSKSPLKISVTRNLLSKTPMYIWSLLNVTCVF